MTKDTMQERNRSLGNNYLVVTFWISAFLAISANVVISQSTGKPLMVIRDANRPGMSYDGRILAAISQIGSVEVYDVEKQTQLNRLSVAGAESVAVSADSRVVSIFAGDAYSTYDIASRNLLPKASAWTLKNGKEYVVVGISNEGGMTSRTISSDLATAVNIFPWWEEPKQGQPALVVGRLRDQSVVAELLPPDGFVKGDVWHREAITPDGKLVAASRFNNKDISRSVTLAWEVSTGNIVLKLAFASHWLSLSEDGRRLVTGETDDGSIQVWDLRTGKLVSTIDKCVHGRPVFVNSGVISPDGNVVATTRGVDLYLWDTATGKHLASIKQDHISEGNTKSVVFSGNGKRLAIGSDTEVVTVWSFENIWKSAASGSGVRVAKNL